MHSTKWHVTTAFIVFLILTVFGIIHWSTLFTATFFTMIPDFDARTKYHRHFFTHSIIIPFPLIFSPIYRELGYILMLSIAIHLVCDISFKIKGGKYCINFWTKGFGYWGSTYWLSCNAVTGITMFVVGVIIL